MFIKVLQWAVSEYIQPFRGMCTWLYGYTRTMVLTLYTIHHICIYIYIFMDMCVMVTLWVSLGLLLLSCIHSALHIEHPCCPRHHRAAEVMRFSKALLTQEAPLWSERPLSVCCQSQCTRTMLTQGRREWFGVKLPCIIDMKRN